MKLYKHIDAHLRIAHNGQQPRLNEAWQRPSWDYVTRQQECACRFEVRLPCLPSLTTDDARSGCQRCNLAALAGVAGLQSAAPRAPRADLCGGRLLHVLDPDMESDLSLRPPTQSTWSCFDV